MSLVVVGLSHKTAPVELREKLAFSQKVLPDALSKLTSLDEVTEAVILSTCNRTEIYAEVLTPTKAVDIITDFIAGYHGLDAGEKDAMRKHLYSMQGPEMVNHLFCVISSLDSMVLGEAQILAQVRNAYAAAFANGACGDIFKHLFQQAFEVGKRVRTETAIGANSVSISTTAVNLAQRIFEDLPQRCVLVVGVGEMGELTLNYLVEQGVKNIIVVNRTVEKAAELADRVSGRAYSFDQLVDCLAEADIVISSTAAPDYVITRDQVKAARKRRRGFSMLLIDIALPRDIEPACADVDDVYLYDLDAFSSIIDKNRAEREVEADNARTMIDGEVRNFLVWMQERKVVPTITHMYQKMDHICAGEVDEAAVRLAALKGAPLSDEELSVLNALAQGVGKKILHGPTIRLRKQASNPDAYRYTDAARFLFGLDTNPLGQHCRNCRFAADCRASETGICLAAQKNGYERVSAGTDAQDTKAVS